MLEDNPEAESSQIVDSLIYNMNLHQLIQEELITLQLISTIQIITDQIHPSSEDKQVGLVEQQEIEINLIYSIFFLSVV